jgi:hypothetical protein
MRVFFLLSESYLACMFKSSASCPVGTDSDHRHSNEVTI